MTAGAAATRAARRCYDLVRRVLLESVSPASRRLLERQRNEHDDRGSLTGEPAAAVA